MKILHTAVLLLIAATAPTTLSLPLEGRSPNQDVDPDDDNPFLGDECDISRSDSSDECLAWSRQPPYNYIPSPPSAEDLTVQGSGLFVDISTCSSFQLLKVQDAIQGVGLLAQAGLMALSPGVVDVAGNPAHYFFGRDISPTLADVLQRAERYSYGQHDDQFPIRVKCRTASDQCSDFLSYAAYVSRSAYNTIVLCDNWFLFPARQRPCLGELSKNGLKGIGGTTRDQLLLGQVVVALSRASVSSEGSGTTASRAYVLNELSPIKGGDSRRPWFNGAAYARFAAWAYDLGLSLGPTFNCLNQFRPDRWAWNALAGEYPTRDLWQVWVRRRRLTCLWKKGRWTPSGCVPQESRTTRRSLPPPDSANRSPNSSSQGPSINCEEDATLPLLRRRTATPAWWSASDTRTHLYADESTCKGDRLSAVRSAIDGVALLAQSGLNALSAEWMDVVGNPAPYFFGPSPDPYVTERFKEALAHATRVVEDDRRIRVTCTDAQHLCRRRWDPTLKLVRGDIAYVASSSADTIVLCDDFFLFPDLQAPCTGEPTQDGITGFGGISQAQLLLHEFTHAATKLKIRDYAYGTTACLELQRTSTADRRPAYNADSYSRMAAWAHDLGLGTEGAPPCLERWQPGVGKAGEMPVLQTLSEMAIKRMGWVEKLGYCAMGGVEECMRYVGLSEWLVPRRKKRWLDASEPEKRK